MGVELLLRERCICLVVQESDAATGIFVVRLLDVELDRVVAAPRLGFRSIARGRIHGEPGRRVAEWLSARRNRRNQNGERANSDLAPSN